MIRILLIEDNPADAGLVDIYLRQAFSNTYLLIQATHLADGLKK